MLDYQRAALNAVRQYASAKHSQYQAAVERVCEPFHVDAHALMRLVLSRPVTINFHPDRLSNNGRAILENLLEQGLYHGQFRTGTTNGGKTAFIGGERFEWEEHLFGNAYPQDALDRPKYGALNLFRYADGASARFGSCFFVLNREINDRCTFAYGDSSSNPTTLCTSDTFMGILAGLFEEVRYNGRMLNRIVSTEQEALAILLHSGKGMNIIGRNLDYCIETHIHGDVSLTEDVAAFYLDGSFKQTPFAGLALDLCQKYGIVLRWIPERQVAVEEIGELFRGAQIPLLARKIDRIFGEYRGTINAALIGEASRDSLWHPEMWKDIGDEADVFQCFKQLWHTVAYFG